MAATSISASVAIRLRPEVSHVILQNESILGGRHANFTDAARRVTYLLALTPARGTLELRT
jgi:hypothetical protein